MSTGTKLVQGALSRLGAHSPLKPAGPEAIDVGKDTLNSMYSSWQDDSIEFGAMPLEAVGDEFSEPMGLTNTIMDNLALLLQPQFPGTGRETLPKGQGNQHNRYWSNTYFDKGEEIG